MAELVSASALDAPPAPVELADAPLTQEEAYRRGYVDINFFAALALPHVMISALPVFYVIVWQILVNREQKDLGKILRFALGLPRGHAKTTFIKVVIAWLIVYDKISFPLIVCANESLAEQILADIDDILSSPNMEAVYGDWTAGKSTDTKELKKCIYHKRSVVIAAKGAGSSLRGLNIKHTRPDFILCDDAQTRENDESPTERAKLLRWIVATCFKVIAPRGDRTIVYVGNMYSEDCLLNLFRLNASWISLITGAILDSGEPLWPELHSLESLMESYYHDEELGLATLWFAEVMNDPQGAATSLLPQPLVDCPHSVDTIVPDGVFMTIDPAGFRKQSDANELIVHYVFDGACIAAKRASSHKEPDLNNPEKIVLRALEMAVSNGASVIGVESVGYQQTLKFWLEHYIEKLGIRGIYVVELSPHGRSKETRIKQDIQEMYALNNYISDEIRADYIWQATKYKIGKKDNKDDLLDAIAYRNDVRNEYWHLVKNLLTEGRTYVQASVQDNNTPF